MVGNRPFHRSRAVALSCLVLALCLGASAASAVELRGHGGPVRAIAVTPDSATAVTGSFDSTVILWSLADGRARQVLRFHAGQVTAVAALSNDRFASAGEDGRIAIWQAGRETPAAVLEGHTAPVAALSWSPEQGVLASASWDSTVRLWTLETGQSRTLSGHTGNVNAVAFRSDGSVVSASYDAAVRLWPKDANAAPSIRTLPTALNTLAVLPGDRLALGGADGRLRVLSAAGQAIGEVEISPTPIIALAVSADGRTIAAAGLKGAISLLDAETLQPRHRLSGPGLPVWSLAFTPDSRILLTGGSDRVVRRWDVKTGAQMDAGVGFAPHDEASAFEDEPGARVFKACAACHALSADAGNRAGPTLHGVFGRKIASVPGYPYSAALRGMDIVWTPETVARLFEVGPQTYTPGTKMPEQTINSAEDRAALVRFLEKATSEHR